MRRPKSLLVSLVLLVDRVPWPPEPAKRPRGRPTTSSARLIMKAVVIMIIRRLYTAYALLTFLNHAAPLPRQLRALLSEQRRCPSRRTWARRLAALPPSLPGLSGGLGRHLVTLLQPWARHGRAVACDSPPLATGGGVWHKQHREHGGIPHSSIDTEAGWSKSGWHGWWYGWNLPLAVTVGSGWIPRAAELTVAHQGDTKVAPWLGEQGPGEVRSVLGDTHDNDPDLRRRCHQHGCELVATRRGPYPHRDGGVEVRNIFHQRRSQAIEPVNGLCKNVFECRVKMPVKGRLRSQRLALGAVVVSQLAWLYQPQQGLPVGQGIKPLLRAA